MIQFYDDDEQRTFLSWMSQGLGYDHLMWRLENTPEEELKRMLIQMRGEIADGRFSVRPKEND